MKSLPNYLCCRFVCLIWFGLWALLNDAKDLKAMIKKDSELVKAICNAVALNETLK